MSKILTIFIVSILLIGISGCQSPTKNTDFNETNLTTQINTEQSLPDHQVIIEKVGYNSIQESLSYIGTIKASEEITIKSRAEGIVSSVYFKEGDFIKQADIIADLRDPKGDDPTQINYQISQTNLETARNNLQSIREKTAQSMKNAEIALQSANQRLKDTQVTLDKTLKQTSLSINNSEIQLKNTQQAYKRLQDSIDLMNIQLSLNVENLDTTSEITYTNTENALELTLYSTIPSIFITLNNLGLSNGLSRLERDLEDLQDDHNDIRRHDADDILNLLEDIHDFIIDLTEYLTDEANSAPDTIPTILSNLGSIDSQLQGLKIAVTNTQNLLDSISINNELQLKTLLDQLKSIEEQSSILENALEVAKAQSSLTEHSLTSNINQLKIDIESKQININLTKIGNEMEINNAESQVKTVELQLKQASIQSKYLQIESTINGVISSILIEKGQLVYPREPIMNVYNPSKTEIVIYANTKEIKNLSINNKVYIYDSNKTEIVGRISEIHPTANPNTRLIPIIIAVENSSSVLIPNSTVNIDIPIHSKTNNIYAPLKSVLIREGGNYVFVSKNGVAKKQIVTLGKIFGSKVQIMTGLKVGDLLIVEGNRNIKEGAKINIISDK